MEFNKEIAEDLVKRFSYFHNERLEGFGGVEEYEEIVAAILAVAQVQMEFELEYAESPVSVQDKPMFPTPGATKFLEERKKRQELEDAQLEEEERNE